MRYDMNKTNKTWLVQDQLARSGESRARKEVITMDKPDRYYRIQQIDCKGTIVGRFCTVSLSKCMRIYDIDKLYNIDNYTLKLEIVDNNSVVSLDWDILDKQSPFINEYCV